MDTQIESTEVVKQVSLKCVPMSSLFIDNHQIHALGYRISFNGLCFVHPDQGHGNLIPKYLFQGTAYQWNHIRARAPKFQSNS
jgi:hypothetical protein